jgi:tRNA1(Val) A37 N6-methylase TrmN6
MSVEGAGSEPADEGGFTRDTLLRGRVKLLQPAQGYRSSLDPVLLAAFVEAPMGEFLDIGCASGALSFLLLAKDSAARGTGIEIQPRLAALAEQGRVENGFFERFRVVVGDVRAVESLPAQSFDLVAINPPFRPVGTGVLPPRAEKALANHEVALTLQEWVESSARLLRPMGRLCTIFPADRSAELRAQVRARAFHVARSRLVVPRLGEAPSRILLEASRCAGQEVTLPPLLVHEGRGYVAEVRRMMGEEA